MGKSTLELPIKNKYMGGRGYGELKHMSSTVVMGEHRPKKVAGGS